MNRSYPAFLSLTGTGEKCGLTIHQNFATRRLIDTRQRFDERRLTRAVVAKQAEHFAFTDLEVDIVQNINMAKRFVDVSKFENGFLSGHCRSPYFFLDVDQLVAK